MGQLWCRPSGARVLGRRAPAGPELGAVTAEVAMVLPAVVALLGLLLAGATAGVAQLQLEKAAQAAVRQLGRGEPVAHAAATVSRIAGETARLSASTAGGWVSVKVIAQVPGPWGLGGGWMLEAEAAVPAEPAGYEAGPPGDAGSGSGG